MTTQLNRAAASDEEPSRAKRIKAATRQAHEALDTRIMRFDPFANLGNYARFLHVQHDFHSMIDALYDDVQLQGLLPDLRSRRRLELIRQDLADVGATVPSLTEKAAAISYPASLGWLYTAEGSNLGAAFLLKAARGLELSESFGARHLAAHSDGRGLHWRTFTTALDAVELDLSEEEAVIVGASDAFASVQKLVERYCS